jgi:hypothetical protein
MTTAHIFYIPLVLFIGFAAGWALGRKAVFAELEEQQAAEARRAARRAQREAAAEQQG